MNAYGIAFLLALCIACTPSLPALAKSAPPQTEPKLADFAPACVEGFMRSSEVKDNPAEARKFAQRICECTVKESKHQGATAASVQAETARIKADPKYQISDPKLLAAFQYCTIELLRD